MNIILFDDEIISENLLPLTYTRPVSKLRCGILTIDEKWEKYLDSDVSFYTKHYLQEKFPLKISDSNLLINSSILPDEVFVENVVKLADNQCLVLGNEILAARLGRDFFDKSDRLDFDDLQRIEYDLSLSRIVNLWDIFRFNEQEIRNDFVLLTQGRASCELSSTNVVFDRDRIFVEEGARVECAVLDPQDGYIYIGKNASVMENSVVKGSFALCESSVLKVRTTVYGATTIGPYSKVGGEISNSVVVGYSNKAHDGFLGNSVLGEWCNIGAGTNNSNLKNNYANVKLWNYSKKRFVDTGLQFCGLIMGDHSKCGINTMFNTGTVVGVSANIYGSGFPRNFIPSFSWGGAQGFTEYKFAKAIETAKKVMLRRQKDLDSTEENILRTVYELSSGYRR